MNPSVLNWNIWSMDDTLLRNYCLKLDKPVSIFSIAHFQNRFLAGSNNYNKNALTTTSLQTQIEISEFYDVYLFLSLARNCVHFQAKSLLQRRNRLRKICMKTCKALSLFPERCQMVFTSTDESRSNSGQNAALGNSSLSFCSTQKIDEIF